MWTKRGATLLFLVLGVGCPAAGDGGTVGAPTAPEAGPLGRPPAEPAPAPAATEAPGGPSAGPGVDDAPPSVGADTWTVAIAGESSPAAASPARVVGVRFGRHPDHERIVVELDGPIPGWRALYVDHPVRTCDGEVVPLPGDAHLEIDLRPARSGGGVPERWDPGLDDVLALARTCDRAGRVVLVLGLRSPEPFRVSVLQGPPRLVLDVRRPARP